MMILFEFPQEQNSSILTAAYERLQLREETYPISRIYSLKQSVDTREPNYFHDKYIYQSWHYRNNKLNKILM